MYFCWLLGNVTLINTSCGADTRILLDQLNGQQGTGIERGAKEKGGATRVMQEADKVSYYKNCLKLVPILMFLKSCAATCTYM